MYKNREGDGDSNGRLVEEYNNNGDMGNAALWPSDIIASASAAPQDGVDKNQSADLPATTSARSFVPSSTAVSAFHLQGNNAQHPISFPASTCAHEQVGSPYSAFHVSDIKEQHRSRQNKQAISDEGSNNEGTCEGGYTFHHGLTQPTRRILRGWDRIARSPHKSLAARQSVNRAVKNNIRGRGGSKRKVWKRPESALAPKVGMLGGIVSRKDNSSGSQESRQHQQLQQDGELADTGSANWASSDVNTGEKRTALAEMSSNTPRAVKKLRLKDHVMPLVMDRPKKNGVVGCEAALVEVSDTKVKYLTTLRDGPDAIGTPKRKRSHQRKNGDLEKTILENVVQEPANVPKICSGDDFNEVRDVETDSETDIDITKHHLAAHENTTKQSGDDAQRATKLEEASGLFTSEGALQTEDNDKEGSTDLERAVDDCANEEPMVGSSDPTPPTITWEDQMDMEASQGNDTDGNSLKLNIEKKQSAGSEIYETGQLSPVPEKSLEKPCKQKEDNITSEAQVPTKSVMCRTPRAKASFQSATPTPRMMKAHVFETPQIGTTLLRRESLRSRTSPRKRNDHKNNARETKSPHNFEQGLKKRDTLQEREILQHFNETVGAEPIKTVEQSLPMAQDVVQEDTSLKKVENLKEHETSTPINSQSHQEDVSSACSENDSDGVDSAQGCSNGFPKETQGKIVEDQEVIEDVSTEAESTSDQEPTDVDPNDKVTLEKQNSPLPEEEDAEAGPATPMEVEQPARKTRSGARFSDDTTLLREFLFRAQIKKAAKEAPILTPGPIDQPPEMSPRRSPRKGKQQQQPPPPPEQHQLGLEFGPASSPVKNTATLFTRPGTPTRKCANGEIGEDEGDEMVSEPTSHRRSTRSRLPAPSKAPPPGAPSFIPVRRGDGTEAMILPKTQAQDLAIVTRTNTRRNKGQAKPPLQALQEILPGSTSPQKKNGNGAGAVVKSSRPGPMIMKAVSWAETLASYQDSKDGSAVEDGAEDAQRPRVRRMRGLGSVNGTPAKKTSGGSAVMGPAVPSSVSNGTNGTPAPKRRGKTVR